MIIAALCGGACGRLVLPLTALDDEGKVIAKFLVAADLSAVYRNDKEDEVSLIYGDPINMLAAKRAPLVEEDELEGPAIESGELEGDEDAPDLPATAASELSPLVTVAPEEASLKVGERTRIVALLPGCVGYNVTDLRSSNSDIVKVDGDVQLLAVKRELRQLPASCCWKRAKRPL